MKAFPTLCSLLLIIVLAIHRSEANQICRCNHRLGVGGEQHTGKLTQKCGQGYYCYTYIGYPYCEVGKSMSLFEACCNAYGGGGVKCLESSLKK